MSRWLSRLAAWCPLAWGRTQPLTECEARCKAWGGMPKAYTQTQPANYWKLRMSRHLWKRSKRA